MRLIVHGAAGRLGRRIVALAAADPAWEVVAAIVRPGDPRTGRDAGALAGADPTGVSLGPEPSPLPKADVAIDVSTAEACPGFCERAAAQGIPSVVATTGLSTEGRAALERAAERVPILVAPNLSTGVALLTRLVREAARALGTEADIEVVEAHHSRKRDAPSGTALALATAAAHARGQAPAQTLRHGRAGCSPGGRPPGEIGLHAVRAGDIVGEHTVTLAFGNERLELVHRAHDRTVFARGGLRAAAFLAEGPPPGIYGPEDALARGPAAGSGGAPPAEPFQSTSPG
jgi:4-hydroxy-tetrahydrodipicolinate reductase